MGRWYIKIALNGQNDIIMSWRIPFTKAYVEDGARYEDSDVKWWLGTPKQVELNRFEYHHGSMIPDDYLTVFKNDLRRLTEMMMNEDNTNKIIHIKSMLFQIKFCVDTQRDLVILKEIVIRPCAEKRGFFRIILYQFIRVCLRLACDFYVESPYAATKSVLSRAFGPVLERFTKVINHGGIIDEMENYIKIDCNDLVVMDLGERLNLVTEEKSNDLLEFRPFPEIHCIPTKFPSANIMNFGPRADDRKRGRDSSYDETEFSPTAPRFPRIEWP